jgi:iron complex transport system permease protein
VKAGAAIATCAVALVVAVALGITFGTDSISLPKAFGDPASLDHYIVFEVRLPRVLLAAIAGAGLSIVGVALQSLLRNPLAEPFVLGVSGGAALGATIVIHIGLSTMTLLGTSLIPLGALVGGLAATALVHALAAAAGGSRSTTVLLAGVIVNAIASSAITTVKTLVAPVKAQELLYWLVGNLERPMSPASIAVLAAYVAVGSAVLLRDAARLNVLSLGDDAAEHLGIGVRAVELRTLVASALVVGAIVSTTGLIGFVGLFVPHILRRVLGADARTLMPASLVLGAAALVLCDLLSRGAFRAFDRELPVGVITALLGGPLFLVLLRRRA